jgi:alkanesulfonate monooxygenase SsuD/methylene tetrahydromethanopterin reductase-like flavin-dependent oxidoreductase (luciferase family)
MASVADVTLREVPADTQSATPSPRRLRLGFLTHLHIGADAADSYRIALDLFQAAEELGFDSGWVAQHHFLNGSGRLPSTLTFLAAAAQRTRRIQLGTAIVILPLEDPLRVAEDAAVVDTLSGGRLQLGLGTGGDPPTFAAFGKDLQSRRERFADGVKLIERTLRGEPINGTTAQLYPPAPTLVDRIWESTLSVSGGERIGRQYLREHQHPIRAPHIGLSRAVYPATDRATAIAHLDQGVATYVDTMIQRGFFPTGLSQDAYYARSHIHYGHPEEVVASLQSDLVLPFTSELICQVHPGHPTPDQITRALERIANEVAPALGWRKPV